MRRHTKAGALIEAILILAGAALLGKAFMAGATTFKFVGYAQHADGVISGIFDHGFSGSVEFNADQGATIVFTQDGPFFSHTVGEQVPIIFDPAELTRAMVDTGTMLWFTPVMLTIAASLFFLLGFRLRGVRNL